MTSIIVFIKSIFTANRVAAIVAFLGSLSAFILGVVQVFPGTWTNVALAAVGVLGKVITALKFLEGSQNWDRVTQGRLAEKPLSPPPATI